MANPLKELPLKVTSMQKIQEVAIDAPPERVWTALQNVSNWFQFETDRSKWNKHTLDMTPGGRWIMEGPGGSSSLVGMVTHIEPGKLLRISGPMGLTHLPVMNAFIFELQPRNEGKGTLLRLGQRTFGFVDEELPTRMEAGWMKLLGNLKNLAEKGA
jgi:uncharacterized protein YndB with AHSA1/START domain